MSSESVIRASKIGKTFRSYGKPHHRLAELFMPSASKEWGRDFQALSDVDFEVFKGETVGILGRNGSGKSTFLQILCGIMEPTRGEMTVTGRIAALLELGAGFNPEFTGRENVRLYAGVLGLDSAAIERKLPEIIAFADIGHFIDEPVKHYSSGMFVRLAFSVAIHVDPEILVVDEALSVGDEAFQRKCFSRIEEIKRMGATILFVSHSAPAILQLCDRAMVLHQGRRIYFGKPNSAVAIYQRIIYAPNDRIDGLIAQAHALDREGGEWRSENSSRTDAVEASLEAPDFDVERFDPGLISQSAFEFERQGACISEPRITNSLGETINVLRHGASYRYEFDVYFERHASHVHFGMLVKSVSGVELAGASSHRFDETAGDVAAGSRIRVRFHWRCNLLPGMYFLNAGCNGVLSEEIGETFLHRIVDAFAFRVEVAERPRRTAGFFDVLTEPFVELESLED
jgi:lipopolysaccharide transport system ATP-binding protein